MGAEPYFLEEPPGNDLYPDVFWNPMPSPPPSATFISKKRRSVDNATSQMGRIAPSFAQHEHLCEHIDPMKTLCRYHCSDTPTCALPCEDNACPRPSKRKASTQRVSEFHHVSQYEPDAELARVIDACLESCSSCCVNSPCPDPCALPCSGDSECLNNTVCYDNDCDQMSIPCFEPCEDPACTKVSCPNEPCCCSDCHIISRPLDAASMTCDPLLSASVESDLIGNMQYHNSYSYPTPTSQSSNANRLKQIPYPNFSNHQSIKYRTDEREIATQTAYGGSSTATPDLSPGACASLDSSPAPRLRGGQSCILDIPYEHCHIDHSCCHGYQRDCEECPSISQDQLHLLDSSFPQLSDPSRYLNNLRPQHENLFSFPNNQQPMSAHNNATSLPSPALNYDAFASWPSGSFDGLLGIGFEDHSALDLLASTTAQCLSAERDPSTALSKEQQFDPLKSTGRTSPRLNLDIRVKGDPLGHEDDKSRRCRWNVAPRGSQHVVTCSMTFKDSKALHSHIKKEHVDKLEGRCFCQWEGCDSADKDFKQRSKLSRHLLVHAEYKPYACGYQGCNKTFATNQAKDNHERTHTGMKPYICTYCSYGTTTHTQLQTHINAVHTKSKSHQCRYCDFKCADSSNLSKHERTHKARPFRCWHPGCQFKPDCRWENVKRHFRKSGHCPELLVDGSVEQKKYKEAAAEEAKRDDALLEEKEPRRKSTGPGAVKAEP